MKGKQIKLFQTLTLLSHSTFKYTQLKQKRSKI